MITIPLYGLVLWLVGGFAIGFGAGGGFVMLRNRKKRGY